MKIFNVILLNTCSRNKRRKNCAESRWRSQSALFRPLAMPCLIDAKISSVPKHQLIVPSTLLALATNIRRYKATKIHTLTPLTYELFFQNSSKITYAHNLQVKVLDFDLFTIRRYVKERKLFTTKFAQTILGNHLGIYFLPKNYQTAEIYFYSYHVIPLNKTISINSFVN